MKKLKLYIHRWGRVGLNSALVFAALFVLLRGGDVQPADYFGLCLSEQVGGRKFNFTWWEIGALINKLGMEFAAPQDTLSEAARHDLVIAYLDALKQANRLRGQIEEIYSRYDESAADRIAAAQQAELAALRAWMSARQNLVEGILEEQTSTELEAEGFGLGGYVWPPVKIRFTELPLLLIVSQRAQITREADVHLKAGIPLADQVDLETGVDAQFGNMRSMVTRIGGLSAYPAMILETDSLVWLADTFAHEWAHHYLVIFPLGYNYNASGEMTTLNETSASIIGREIGQRIILRYYPELADQLPAIPVPPDCVPMSAGELVWPEEPPPEVFDYSREMRQTRLWVDNLLEEGKVEQAEEYMELRRQTFVEQGYQIRKLNQAFFAFHGSYATSPSTGNPLGGQLEWLRGQSETLRVYVREIAAYGSYPDLKARLMPFACAP
ncbi:MAG: hypothetical protein JW934_09000 [Anaerolineae bacterium]|nr:hypothetical protein [Anaerolineae bacterium]